MLNRKRSQAGFTLIELIIVVAILGILAVIIGGAGCVMFGGRGSAANAERELQVHASKLGWDVKGVACAAIDSDGDGYISCTASVQEGDRRVEKAVECASGALLTRTGGCKVALPKTYVNGQ